LIDLWNKFFHNPDIFGCRLDAVGIFFARNLDYYRLSNNGPDAEKEANKKRWTLERYFEEHFGYYNQDFPDYMLLGNEFMGDLLPARVSQTILAVQGKIFKPSIAVFEPRNHNGELFANLFEIRIRGHKRRADKNISKDGKIYNDVHQDIITILLPDPHNKHM